MTIDDKSTIQGRLGKAARRIPLRVMVEVTFATITVELEGTCGDKEALQQEALRQAARVVGRSRGKLGRVTSYQEVG